MTVDELLSNDISLFDNTVCVYPSHSISLIDYFNDIKTVYMPSLVEYRWYVDNGQKYVSNAKYIKSSRIECVTPSGRFTERKDSELRGRFTGVIVLDLDAKDNVGIDIHEAVKDCQYIPNTLAYHKSVSGEGYAIYVHVDEWKENTYKFARQYYTVMLGVTFDKATSNLSRLRYVSYDPDIWIAEEIEPLIIPEVIKKKVEMRQFDMKPDRLAKSDSIITDLIDTVISNGDDPTSDYADWFSIGCALANAYGESGRQLFHKVSSNYHAYNPDEVDKKYDSIIRLGNYKAGKGTIVFLLSKYQ